VKIIQKLSLLHCALYAKNIIIQVEEHLSHYFFVRQPTKTHCMWLVMVKSLSGPKESFQVSNMHVQCCCERHSDSVSGLEQSSTIIITTHKNCEIYILRNLDIQTF